MRIVHPALFVAYFMLCMDLKCVITAFVSEISQGHRVFRQLVNGVQVVSTADVNFRQHLTNTSKDVKVDVNEPDHSHWSFIQNRPNGYSVASQSSKHYFRKYSDGVSEMFLRRESCTSSLFSVLYVFIRYFTNMPKDFSLY